MTTARTLVLVTHPNIDTSVVNKRWLTELQANSDIVTLNELYARYPDQHIDVRAEQDLLLAHDNIILQFPLYWFSTPPLLKKWMDEVLLQGFAYGSQHSERKLAGKRIGLAISAGIKEIDFRATGRYAHTLEDFLMPLRSTIDYISAESLPTFAFYGVEEGQASNEVEMSAAQYIQYIKNLQ